MGSFAPIRDSAGGIIGMQAKDETLFAETLRETMDAVGATEAPKEEGTQPARRRFGRLELAGVACGLVLAVAAIAAMNAFTPVQRPLAQPTAAPAATAVPTTRPTPTMALQDAYAAPDGAKLGTVPLTSTISYQDSAHPGWGGIAWEQGSIVWVQTDPQGLVSLPDLRPVPTNVPQRPVTAPVVVPAAPQAAPAPIVEACDPQVNPRYTSPLLVDPIGSVVGASCTSQAEADANAIALAEQMRAAAEPSAVPPTSSAQ